MLMKGPDTPANTSDTHPVGWQVAMKRAIRSQAKLREIVGLPVESGHASDEDFATFVPLEMVSRIRYGDPNDPILRQVLATPQEQVRVEGFSNDPVGDLDASIGGGLIQKYAGRALLVTHGACAVHCRYCFRREFPYSDVSALRKGWKTAIELIRADETIQEVLLSGGDPLTLTDSKLDELIGQIESIAHVRRLRFHSRLPIASPQRLTDPLIRRLASSRLLCWFVVHANHAAEIDAAVAASLGRLRDAGIPVLNQSVLLAGVNHDVDTLVQLSERLIDLGVQPYYLHQLDQVHGASHFWVDPETGKQLIRAMRERLPGYAIPTYVSEVSGRPSKSPVD
ncbi:MAG: EF-P beta-lysylation protein EpmB [Planctomycetota bacterium]